MEIPRPRDRPVCPEPQSDPLRGTWRENQALENSSVAAAGRVNILTSALRITGSHERVTVPHRVLP